MAATDKVRAEEFQVVTALSVADIRAAVLESVEDARRALVSSMVVEDTGDGIDVIERGPGGLVKRLWITIHWSDSDDGRHVKLAVTDVLLVQDRIFWFIPFGPKTAPALGTLRRFCSAFRSRLDARA